MPVPEDAHGVGSDDLPYVREPMKIHNRVSGSALAWVGGVLALVVILALGFWAITQRDEAADARDQLATWQNDVGRLSEELDATERALRDSEAEATSLAAQAETLRTQVEELGGELEASTIEGFLVATDRETLREIAERGPVVASEMQRCADARGEVANRAIELVGAPPEAPRTAFTAALANADQICTQAVASLTQLQEDVDDIDQPAPEE
jgi:chromosome segregation ATPase